MNSAQIKSVIFLAVLTLIMMSLLREPAFAGKLSIINSDESHSYLIFYGQPKFGNNERATICVSPGESRTLDGIVNAYTWFGVMGWKCSCDTYNKTKGKFECNGKVVKEYFIENEPTAFRKYVITIAKGPQAVISELE